MPDSLHTTHIHPEVTSKLLLCELPATKHRHLKKRTREDKMHTAIHMSEPTDTAKQDHRQNCVNDVENNVPAIDYILVLQIDAEKLAASFKTELSQEWVIEMAHKACKGCIYEAANATEIQDQCSCRIIFHE